MLERCLPQVPCTPAASRALVSCVAAGAWAGMGRELSQAAGGPCSGRSLQHQGSGRCGATCRAPVLGASSLLSMLAVDLLPEPLFSKQRTGGQVCEGTWGPAVASLGTLTMTAGLPNAGKARGQDSGSLPPPDWYPAEPGCCCPICYVQMLRRAQVLSFDITTGNRFTDHHLEEAAAGGEVAQAARSSHTGQVGPLAPGLGDWNTGPACGPVAWDTCCGTCGMGGCGTCVVGHAVQVCVGHVEQVCVGHMVWDTCCGTHGVGACGKRGTGVCG